MKSKNIYRYGNDRYRYACKGIAHCMDGYKLSTPTESNRKIFNT